MKAVSVSAKPIVPDKYSMVAVPSRNHNGNVSYRIMQFVDFKRIIALKLELEEID